MNLFNIITISLFYINLLYIYIYIYNTYFYSAGIGRTGTLIAIDIILQHLRDNKKLDVFGTVYRLRRDRINMVQKEVGKSKIFYVNININYVLINCISTE